MYDKILKMTSKFGIIIDILNEAFKNPVSEHDYYMIVEVLRNYSLSRCDAATERHELLARGWSITYDPCEYMERIRFAMCFGGKDNSRIQDMLRTIHLTV